MQFTRNDREAGRVNGATAAVTVIDAQARTIAVREAKGPEHTLQLDQAGDRHLRHGWIGTVHGSQGAMADQSMTRLESIRANTVDANRLCRDQPRQEGSRDLHRQPREAGGRDRD